MNGPQPPKYRAEQQDQLSVAPLDAMTAIYQRRSGITHIVAEPVPEILSIMGNEVLSAAEIAERLSAKFEFDSAEAEDIVAARLEEMAALGLLERASA